MNKVSLSVKIAFAFNVGAALINLGQWNFYVSAFCVLLLGEIAVRQIEGRIVRW